MEQEQPNAVNRLEYFLIRTLPSRKQRIPFYSGNRNCPLNNRKVSKISLSLEEDGAAAMGGIFAVKEDYSPAQCSAIKQLLYVQGNLLAIGSLTGSIKNSKHLAPWVTGKTAR